MKRVKTKFFNILKVNYLIDDFINIFGTPTPQYDEMNYEKYWEKRGRGTYVPKRFHVFNELIKDESTVLDVGCGNGAFLINLKERKANIKELGIDVSSEAIRMAQMKSINAEVATIDEIHQAGKTFDYVIESEVIEHVPNSEAFIKLGFLMAKKALIISIPNSGYYTYRVRFLFGRFPIQWVHHPGEHLRFWTIVDFKKWIPSIGIEGYLMKIVPLGGIPILCKILPNLFSKQICCIISKIEPLI